MNKTPFLLLVAVILVFFIVLPGGAITATSGACSGHGGVSCAAGSDWDGSVICNDGWKNSSVSYSSMVMCQGYNSPSYSNPSIPSCPSMSSYDSLSGSCKCYSGYMVSGGKCISTSQYCTDLLGFNGRYNILTDSCECGYGYVISGSRCVSGDSLCRDKYGLFSSYDSLSKNCECDYGYVFDFSNQCVSEDDYCQDLYGYNADYNILTDKCECRNNYVFDSSMKSCISGDSDCQNKYGYHSSYDSWGKTCECDSGYIFSGSNCVDDDTYCYNQYGDHSSYSTLIKGCVCDYGYKLNNGECVTPEISRVFPLEVEINGDITVQGSNLGDSKYGDLKLYVGSVAVNLSDISTWQSDKIIFEAGDYLESGYIVLKGGTTNIRSSYLEVLEPKKEYVPVYSPPVVQEPQLKQVSPSQDATQAKPQQKTQSSGEIKLEPQSSVKEPQLSKPQELKGGEQYGGGNVIISDQQEQKQGQKQSVSTFLASAFSAAKSFFGRFFK